MLQGLFQLFLEGVRSDASYQPDTPLAIQHDVRRLYVTVHDPVAVGLVHRAEEADGVGALVPHVRVVYPSVSGRHSRASELQPRLGDLPVTLSLGDDDAMMPTMKLSGSRTWKQPGNISSSPNSTRPAKKCRSCIAMMK